jgi:hypothetical protein
MIKILNTLVGLIAVALIAFGFYSVFSVNELTGITGLRPEGALGYSEMRAIYGAFILQGAMMLYGLYNPRLRAPILMIFGLVWAWYVIMRVVSIGFEGYVSALSSAFISETIVALLLIAAGWLAREGSESRS